MSIFILNWAENNQPVIELYQPQITPPTPLKVAGRRGAFIWRILLHHVENPPIDWEVGEGGRYAFGLAWLIFTTAIVF